MHREPTMKLHTVSIFAFALTWALFLDSTEAQSACTVTAAAAWGFQNLDQTCQGNLLTMNNSAPTDVQLPPWRVAVEYVCTTDSCGGALYRYFLANQCTVLANGLQNRCATNGRDRCYCGEPVMPPAAGSPLICRRNITLASLGTCRVLGNTTIGNVTVPQCTDDCRTELVTIRDYLGCCFNKIYNTTGSPLNGVLMGAENYTMWAFCSVTTPPDACSNVLSDMGPTTMAPTTAGSDAITASKMLIGLLLTLAFVKALFY